MPDKGGEARLSFLLEQQQTVGEMPLCQDTGSLKNRAWTWHSGLFCMCYIKIPAMAASLSSEAGAAVLLSACLAIWTASFSSG